MKNFSLFTLKPKHQPSMQTDPEEDQRSELCTRLAENLHDLGACEFSMELRAGGERFIVRVSRAEPCMQ
jgi:hypothetical protein